MQQMYNKLLKTIVVHNGGARWGKCIPACGILDLVYESERAYLLAFPGKYQTSIPFSLK